MDKFSFATIPDGAVASRPANSRLDIVTSPDGKTSGVCQVVSLNPFSFTHEDGNTIPIYDYYYIAFADFLAVKHLNEGDGSLVKELQGLNESCNIRFGLEYIDTAFDPQVAGNAVLSRLGSESNKAEQGTSHEFNPCFFAESTTIGASQHVTSFLTSLHEYIEVSGMIAEEEFNNKEMHPKFVRTIPDNSGTAEAVVQYAREILKTEYLAILHVDVPTAISLVREIRAFSHLGDTEDEFHIEAVVLNLSWSNIKEVVTELKELRFNTILAILPEPGGTISTEKLMNEAFEQGIAGSGSHTWIFTVDSSEALSKPIGRGSVLHQVYKGSGMIVSGDYRGTQHSQFAEVLHNIKKSNDFQSYLSMLPVPKFDTDESLLGYYHSRYGEDDTTMMRYRYDATVLAGIAACNAVNNSLFLDRDEFYEQVLRTEFQGTSGRIKLKEDTGSRVTNSSLYSMLNLPDLSEIQAPNVEGESEKFYLGFHSAGEYMFGEWNTNNTSFTFNDGSTQAPPQISMIYESDEYALKTVTVVTAIFLCVIPIIFALYCAIWTGLNQNKRIVRASQPFFLYFIAAGTIILALAIVPQVFEYPATSIDGLMIGCNASLWLILIGSSVTHSAFFAKTHRIVKIVKASKRCKRITITIRDAAIPMAVVLACNIILLTLVSIVDPFDYEAVPFGEPDRFGRTREAYGRCVYSDFTVTQGIFLILAGILNLGLVCLCAFEAYRARTLATEFQETEHILKAVLSAACVFCIGLPVTALNKTNADIRLFISSIMIFAYCMVDLGFMFLPKIFHKESKEQRPNVHVYTQETQETPDYRSSTSSDSRGERILTSKTRGELVIEIAELRKRLAASMVQGGLDRGSV